MGLTLVTPPAAEPLSVEDAKTHLYYTADDQDVYIGALVKAARERVEAYTGRALITQTWRLTRDRFPGGIEPLWIPRPPLASVTSITYVDDDGVTQTLDSGLYRVGTDGAPGRITPAYNEVWPTTRPVIEAVQVTYQAGYGAAASAVPEAYIEAIRLIVGHTFEHRGDNPGALKVPAAALWLVDAYKVGRYPGCYEISG